MYNSNPDDYAKYRENNGNAQEIDYARPEYYHAPDERSAPHSAQPDPYASYQQNPYEDSYKGYSSYQPSTPDPYATDKAYQPYVSSGEEYRGPQSVEKYAAQQSGDTSKGGSRKGIAGLGGILLAIGSFLLKFKSLAFLLKFGGFGFSALLSVVAYSFLFGWQFAVGLVVMLFIHEMGHALVMKLKGIPMGGMIFVPLLGAAVTMRQMPKNAKDEAEVGIAGPIAGALAASACLLLALQQPGAIWAPLAYFGFFMNLFNLIPIVPFDGGRVLAAIDRRVWIIGFVALLGYQIWQWMTGNFYPWLLLFVFMAATQLWSRGLRSQNAESLEYYNVPMSSRILMGLLYFGLVAVLFLGMTFAHNLMPIKY
ncbi:hypothetical protein KDA_04870 [Dictyobacter alpinus]|uniref:Peptidase M50 domain-containing protein n=1 Tax=Dictyobacter alpinus TaxID=2014873 RepID=A0A402B0Y4_9CHLR|nr:site-2 protease family protein [Dictyobacter alpinus]GCE25003.1 hypothetical protein KDA_04870 [Dictyobacter alpinus]